MKLLPPCLLAATLLSGFAATAQQPDELPLRSKNPNEPLTALSDRTFMPAEIKAGSKLPGGMPVGTFAPSQGSGPITLVVDYTAALRDSSSEGRQRLSIELSCPGVLDGCGYPVEKSFMTFESSAMARSPSGGAAGAALVSSRQWFEYTMPKGANLAIGLSLKDGTNMEPVKLVARVVQGQPVLEGIPGQTTAAGRLWKFAGVAALVLAAAGLWLRRR